MVIDEPYRFMPKKSAEPEIIDSSSSVNVGSLKVDLDLKMLMMVALIGMTMRILRGTRALGTGYAPLHYGEVVTRR